VQLLFALWIREAIWIVLFLLLLASRVCTWTVRKHPHNMHVRGQSCRQKLAFLPFHSFSRVFSLVKLSCQWANVPRFRSWCHLSPRAAFQVATSWFHARPTHIRTAYAFLSYVPRKWRPGRSFSSPQLLSHNANALRRQRNVKYMLCRHDVEFGCEMHEKRDNNAQYIKKKRI